jgi:hypothetical protein
MTGTNKIISSFLAGAFFLSTPAIPNQIKPKVPNFSKGMSKILSLEDHFEINNPRSLNIEKRKELKKDLEKYLSNHKIEDIEDAIQYSLEFTGDSLDFRWDYFLEVKGSNYYTFPADQVKTTDCRDYAFLFRETFEYVIKRNKIDGYDCEIMRSKKAKVLGETIDDHDWVRIINNKTNQEWNIDPTFFDYHLGAEITNILE